MVAALFTFFSPQWANLISANYHKELTAKFQRGVLDVELLEKVRSPIADLKATDFRFLRVLLQISLL